MKKSCRNCGIERHLPFGDYCSASCMEERERELRDEWQELVRKINSARRVG